MNAASPRSIDHLVLPTKSLATARARLAALGFTVAPNGLHPFGTENCCVYLGDGTFLEPLAIANSKTTAAATSDGNVFVARDAMYRELRGEEGFSALVFASGDAEADHAAFRRAGLSPGDMLSFSRPFIDAAGKADTASFKLAFAADADAPEAFFFACERVNAPAVDRTALQSHPNGAARLLAVTIESSAPESISDMLTTLTGASGSTSLEGQSYVLGNARIILRAGAPSVPRLFLTGVTFGVSDLAAAEKLFVANGIAFLATTAGLQVAATAGQGAEFTFEAA